LPICLDLKDCTAESGPIAPDAERISVSQEVVNSSMLPGNEVGRGASVEKDARLVEAWERLFGGLQRFVVEWKGVQLFDRRGGVKEEIGAARRLANTEEEFGKSEP
jgi:hypothetical protein